MSKKYTIQVPVDIELKEKVEKYAKSQGFDSLGNFTRFLYRKFTNNGLEVTVSSPVIENLSASEEKRLDKIIKQLDKDKKLGKAKVYTNVEDLMKDLNND
jgi:antitoxin component of RelBE/YafQ-DinJ toxin-antitoxin module